MKITFNPTTKVQSVVANDNDRIIQNSSGNYVYLYGISSGWQVKATFTRRDGFQIGLIGGVYDLGPDDEYCYVIPVPSKATELDKGLGLSILIYEPSGETYIRHSTVATSMYVYTSNNVIVPDDLETVLYDSLNLAISNLTTNKYEYDAIVGGTGETLSKDTPVYSKAKIDELDVVIVSNINTHKARTDNPHAVTKNQVGLGNADNTSDVNKPVSIDQQSALDLKENVSNKKTSWNSTPSNTSYPSEKLTKDSLDLKVNKATTILGINLANDIARAEFVAALGNATALLSGLLSPEDYSLLVTLRAMLGEEADVDTFVNTFNEILAIFQNYPEGADLVTVLNGKVDKEAGKGLSQNDFTDIDKNKVNLSYTHSEIVDGSNPHNTKFVNIADKPTTRDGYGITDVYTKPETYTQLEINNLLDNLSAVKGLKSTLLTPAELSNGDTISTNLLTNNGAYVVFTATNTSTEEVDSDVVPVSTIITGKKFVFFDNQEIVFTIGETNSTFETSEDITLKINLLYLDSENVQAVGVEFDGSLTNYLENQDNVQSAINKLDEELKTTNDNKVDKETGKGLSANNLTDDLKDDYDAAYSHSQTTHAPSNAEQNVQSDWNQTVNTEDDFIKNKPTIPLKTSDLTNDSGFATETYVNNKVSTVYKPQGSVLFSSLVVGLLIEANSGFVYNITDAFTTNENFVEGAGKSHSAGTNVVIIEHSGNYKFDVLGGTVDLTPYELLSNKVTSWSSTTNDTRYPSEKLVKDSLDDKVDKVTDKGLSTNDYTTTEKSKLAGLTVNIPVEEWNTATKTLALSDANKLILCSHTANQTLTIPTNGTVPFPIGRMISFLLTSAYTVTFSGATGVTLTSMDNLVSLATQYAMASLIKTDTDTWQLVGALE